MRSRCRSCPTAAATRYGCACCRGKAARSARSRAAREFTRAPTTRPCGCISTRPPGKNANRAGFELYYSPQAGVYFAPQGVDATGASDREERMGLPAHAPADPFAIDEASCPATYRAGVQDALRALRNYVTAVYAGGAPVGARRLLDQQARGEVRAVAGAARRRYDVRPGGRDVRERADHQRQGFGHARLVRRRISRASATRRAWASTA